MSNHLSSVAMLVDFSVSKPTFRKVDKEKSKEVNDAANASDKASHVSKKLIHSVTRDQIDTVKDRAYAVHAEYTLPWFNKGSRILPVTMHAKYVEQMEKFEAEFWPLVRTFVANYPTYVDNARATLGDLFKETDYPKANRIADKFAWRISYLPVPSGNDFRVTIGQAQIDRIRADVEARVTESATNAVRDMFERIHERVAKMVEGLTRFDPDKAGKDRGTFRDSLVENVRDLVDLLPGLNFSNDARITKLAADMAALVAHDAETLRDSDNIRESVATQAAAIVQAVSDFMA